MRPLDQTDAMLLTAMIFAAGMLARVFMNLRRDLANARAENGRRRADNERRRADIELLCADLLASKGALETLRAEHVDLIGKAYEQEVELDFYHAEDEAKDRVWRGISQKVFS